MEVHIQHRRKGCRLGLLVSSPETRYCARKDAATHVTAVQARKADPSSSLDWAIPAPLGRRRCLHHELTPGAGAGVKSAAGKGDRTVVCRDLWKPGCVQG